MGPRSLRFHLLVIFYFSIRNFYVKKNWQLIRIYMLIHIESKLQDSCETWVLPVTLFK